MNSIYKPAIRRRRAFNAPVSFSFSVLALPRFHLHLPNSAVSIGYRMNNLVDACVLKLRMNVAYMVKYLGFGDDFAIPTSSCAFGSRWLSILLAVGVNIIV